MLDIEKQFCESYNLEQRSITDTECLRLLELILMYFSKISFTNVEEDGFLPYNILSETGQGNDVELVGSGNDIKSTILKHCICASTREEFRQAVHASLIKFGQKVKEALDDAFGEILHS